MKIPDLIPFVGRLLRSGHDFHQFVAVLDKKIEETVGKFLPGLTLCGQLEITGHGNATVVRLVMHPLSGEPFANFRTGKAAHDFSGSRVGHISCGMRKRIGKTRNRNSEHKTCQKEFQNPAKQTRKSRKKNDSFLLIELSQSS